MTIPSVHSMRPAPDEGDIFGPLAHYTTFTLHAPARHPRLAASLLGVCVALGAIAAATMPRKYQVETTVLAQRNPLIGTISNPGMNRDWDTPTRAAREIVVRRDNLLALSREIDLPKRYLATRAPAVRLRDWVYSTFLGRQRTDAQLEDDLVSGLESRLTVGVSGEGTVTIGFNWSDPDIALDVVRTALQSFLDARNAAEMGSVTEAITILQAHDGRVQQDISDAIRKLEAKEQALRIRPATRRTARPRIGQKLDEDLVKLQGQLAARRRTLAELEGARERRLAELQTQLSQYQSVYGPEHPAVVGTKQSIAALKAPAPQAAELRLEIAQLEKAIAQRPGAVVPPPETPAQTTALEEELAAARAALLDQTDPRLEYDRRQLETLLRRHASLLERIEAARIELDTAKLAFQQRYTIISPPKRPKGPIKPYPLMLLGGGLAVGIALACAGAVLQDLRVGRVVEAWQVERTLGLPLLNHRRD